MLILLDKNVPYGVRHFLQNHEVETVEARGWERVRNGDLIRMAEADGFQVLITADQNIVYQQNLKDRSIALIVLGSNIWPIVRKHANRIAEQVESIEAGSYAFLEMPIEKVL